MAEQDTSAVQSVPQAQDVPLRYAGFWVRWAAAIIDGWVTGIVISLVMLPFGFMMGFFAAAFSEKHPMVSITSLGSLTVVGACVVFAYYVFMTHRFGATLGKMAVGARVCAEDGTPLPLGRIALREIIGKFISGLLFYGGFLVAAFTRHKRALHDMMAQSVVVYKNPITGPHRFVVAIVYGISAFTMLIFMTLVGAIVISGMLFFKNAHEDGWDGRAIFDAIEMELHDDAVRDDSVLMDIFTEDILPVHDGSDATAVH